MNSLTESFQYLNSELINENKGSEKIVNNIITKEIAISPLKINLNAKGSYKSRLDNYKHLIENNSTKNDKNLNYHQICGEKKLNKTLEKVNYSQLVTFAKEINLKFEKHNHDRNKYLPNLPNIMQSHHQISAKFIEKALPSGVSSEKIINAVYGYAYNSYKGIIR